MIFSCRRLAAVLMGLILAAMPLQAQSFFKNIDWTVRGSVLFFPENNGPASAPMPILPSLGGGASYPLSKLLALEVSLDLYATTYDYDFTLDRAVPANDEFRAAFVVGSILAFQPVFRFYPGEGKFTIRAFGGLALDLRIIFRAYNLADSEVYEGHTLLEYRKAIGSYFWGKGRFIFPFLGYGMDFPITDGLDLGFDLRAWFPLWRIWSGEKLPGIDSFRFGIGFRLGFK